MAWASNFVLLNEFPKLAELPKFSENPHKWTQLFSTCGAEFRQIVELWLAARLGSSAHADTVASTNDLAAAKGDPYLPFSCPECGDCFASKQAAGLHRRRSHQFVIPIRQMVWGNKCPECGVEFHTRARLIQHLAYDAKLCRASFLKSEPVVLPLALVKELDARDASTSRSMRHRGLPERHALEPAHKCRHTG